METDILQYSKFHQVANLETLKPESKDVCEMSMPGALDNSPYVGWGEILEST